MQTLLKQLFCWKFLASLSRYPILIPCATLWRIVQIPYSRERYSKYRRDSLDVRGTVHKAESTREGEKRWSMARLRWDVTETIAEGRSRIYRKIRPAALRTSGDWLNKINQGTRPGEISKSLEETQRTKRMVILQPNVARRSLLGQCRFTERNGRSLVSLFLISLAMINLGSF